MALTFNKLLASLDNGLVLSPERYHPAKYMKSNGGTKLSEIVFESRDTVSSTSKQYSSSEQAIVLDTSESSNGFLSNEKTPDSIRSLKSAKKIAKVGDVIISRLRPYLRQVAFIDETTYGKDCLLLTSTEYLILRPLVEGTDISFLVPYLLSANVQNVLAISVEGAHHPRFRIDTLMSLEIPQDYYEKRNEICKDVRLAISEYNKSKNSMKALWDAIEPTTRAAANVSEKD